MRITMHTPRVLYLRRVVSIDDINEVLQRLIAVPALVEAEGPVYGCMNGQPMTSVYCWITALGSGPRKK